MRDERGGQAPAERADPRGERVACGGERAADPPRQRGTPEEVDEERGEEQRPDEAVLDERRDVERVRPEVRLPGLELVVDRERVQPEPEERVLREHVGDERVDDEVRVGAAPLGRETRAEHLREELRRAARRRPRAPASEHAERDEELRLQQHAAVRDREHEEPAAEPEQAAPRERREVDDHEEEQQEGERHAEPVAALEPEVDRQEQQDPGGDLDAEVVRVARECVDAVDERALDRAEDVDLAGAARDRLQPGLVEVRAGRLGDGELQQAVGAVRGDARRRRRRA